ncbi:hypothetical protein [Streptomyces sp. NPDC051636]|uniref:hypothetical protein n=1 Tax=Streptomyces sp. NPDC051636 TaxID=3365663 RepID=UPI00378F5FE3
MPCSRGVLRLRRGGRHWPLPRVAADPLRLAVRALPERSAGRVRRAMTGRVVRLLAFPLISIALVLVTELTVYFTPAGCPFVVPVLTREETLPAWCTTSRAGGAGVPRRGRRRRTGHRGDDARHAVAGAW